MLERMVINSGTLARAEYKKRCKQNDRELDRQYDSDVSLEDMGHHSTPIDINWQAQALIEIKDAPTATTSMMTDGG